MAQFQYVNKQGGLTTFDAADQKTALAQLSSFADADKNSGVLAVQGAPQQTPKPIPAASLQTTQQPVTVPPFNPAPAPVIPDVATLMGAFNQPTADQTAAQNEQSDILAQTKAILERQGTQAARQGELETQQGLPQLQKQLNEINAQITNLTGSAFSAQQAAEGRLAPTFAIQGEQAQIERQRSAQTFGLAAAAQALQGNIALANDNVQRALQSEFGGLESKLQYQKLLLDLNRDKLSAADQKKAAAFEIQLNERSRLLAEQKTEREGIYNLAATLGQNGISGAVIGQVLNSPSYGDAIRMAAPFLQSPEQKLALEGAKLDLDLKKIQLATAKKNYSMIGLPSASDVKAAQVAYETAQQQIPLLNDKITLIDSLINHQGLNNAVGPNFLARPVTPFSGAKQDFIAGVAQLVNKETIDSLLNLKAKGGTLGALSDQERILLQSSATRIGQWQILKDGQVVGYNANQADFIKELNQIKMLTQRALINASGNLLSPDEQLTISQFNLSPMTTTTPSMFNPANYF